MSPSGSTTRPSTKIFGMQVAVDPKILIGGLVVLAAVLFWFNSRGVDTSSPSSVAPRVETETPAISTVASRRIVSRRTRHENADRGILRIRPVDATRGDIDPTLRLGLLARLQSVAPPKPGRSLFEIGPEPSPQMAQANLPPVPKGPKIPIAPQPTQLTGPAQPQTPMLNIPLKFYGFVRPVGKGQTGRGLFLEGDNVLVAAEGELIDHRFLVRELSATNARIEDTQMRQGQTIQLVPEARLQ